jgi:uncharacterized protein YjbJ (UPF0337 family)
VKGAAEKANTIRETAGKISGDMALQSEGKIAKLRAMSIMGNIKDAARELKK